MLPIGLTEICLILVAAVVFVKPDDWPKFLRHVGRLYGQMHEYMYRLRQYSRETYDHITSLDQEPEEHVAADPDDPDAGDDTGYDAAEWERQEQIMNLRSHWLKKNRRQPSTNSHHSHHSHRGRH